MELQIERIVRWIRENQERFWAITGTSLLLVLLVFLLVQRQQKERDAAWSELGAAQNQLSQNNLAEARKSLDAWETRFKGSSANSYAMFLKADLAYRTSDYAQAAQVYGELAQSGNPEILRPLALSAQVASEEMAGRYPQAQALAQTFLEKYPDHFLAATLYLAQARLAEIQGDSAAASAVYERIVLLFPQSPWSALAKSKSQNLSKNK